MAIANKSESIVSNVSEDKNNANTDKSYIVEQWQIDNYITEENIDDYGAGIEYNITSDDDNNIHNHL